MYNENWCCGVNRLSLMVQQYVAPSQHWPFVMQFVSCSAYLDAGLTMNCGTIVSTQHTWDVAALLKSIGGLRVGTYNGMLSNMCLFFWCTAKPLILCQGCQVGLKLIIKKIDFSFSFAAKIKRHIPSYTKVCKKWSVYCRVRARRSAHRYWSRRANCESQFGAFIGCDQKAHACFALVCKVECMYMVVSHDLSRVPSLLERKVRLSLWHAWSIFASQGILVMLKVSLSLVDSGGVQSPA